MKTELFLAWLALLDPVTGSIQDIKPYLDDSGHQIQGEAEECNAQITGKPFKLMDGKAVFLFCHKDGAELP